MPPLIIQSPSVRQQSPVNAGQAIQNRPNLDPASLPSTRVANMARTGEMTWQPGVDELAKALMDAYLDGPKVASMDRIPLGNHAGKVERHLKELGSILYFRGTDKEKLLDEVHDAVTNALSEKLIDTAKNKPTINTRLEVLDYTPDKALLKHWVRNNLFDLNFSTNKSVGPVFHRDLSTPQDQRAIDTAFGASAAMVVAMGNKADPMDATLALAGGIANKPLAETAKSLFDALENFVKQPPSTPGDYGVHSEIKSLLDKGFNPKYGGIGRFPEPTDPDAKARMLPWAFKKYSPDPTQGFANREAHEVNLRQLKYYQANLPAYLEAAKADPHKADLLATQLHGTIGQIFNDILFNEKLNATDRSALYNELCYRGVFPDLAGDDGSGVHARRDSALAQLAKLQTLIRSSPLLMEFNPREVSAQVARRAIPQNFGKDAALAEEVLADALVRTTTGGLDVVAGLRGRFPKIHEAIAQGINQRDKAIEKNCMNMPDARLDAAALDAVSRLAGDRGSEAAALVEKIKSGQLLAHGMRPNTIQRAHTLPANLQALAGDGNKEQVFQKALRNEAKFLDREIKELESMKSKLDDSANPNKGDPDIIPKDPNEFAKLRVTELKEGIKEINVTLEELQKRLSIVERLQKSTQLLAKPDFKGIPVRDSQNRAHTLEGLAKEESVAKMIHSAGHRTLCSISGTTTDIGLALVAQYGEATVKKATASLLERANALKNGASLPPLDKKFQSLFATLSFFMQGGQYHTPAEVLGGLLIVAASLHSPEQASNKTAMVAAYKNLLEDFAKNPADYMIADTEVAKNFATNVTAQKNALHKEHLNIIAAGSPDGPKPWKGVKSGDLPLVPRRMNIFFDDSSLPSAPAKKFLITRSKDDIGWRTSIKYDLDGNPVASKEISPEELKPIKDALKKPVGPQNSSIWGQSSPFDSDLFSSHSDQNRQSAAFKEPQPARVDKNEFQKRNLDFAGSAPAIRRHEGFKRERKLARLRAAEEDLAALKAQQGKDISSPVKDSLGAIKNAEGFVPEFAQKGSSQQLIGDEIGAALGVAGYGAGMIKGSQKRTAIAHDLRKAEDSKTLLQQRTQEVELSKHKLEAQQENLKRLESLKSRAELMVRLAKHSPNDPEILEQAQKLPAATEAYQKALAAHHADTETHAKLLAQISQSPDKKRLETQIEDLRYKRGENYSKLFVRYPAGLAASGTGLAATIGQQAGTIAATSTAGVGLAWAGKVFALFGAISVAVSGWRIVRNWKANNRLEAMVENADKALAKRRREIAMSGPKAKNSLSAVLISERLREPWRSFFSSHQSESWKDFAKDQSLKKSKLQNELTLAIDPNAGQAASKLAEQIVENTSLDQFKWNIDLRLFKNPYDDHSRIQMPTPEEAIQAELHRVLEDLVKSSNEKSESLIDNKFLSRVTSEAVATGASREVQEALESLNNEFPGACNLPSPNKVIELMHECKAELSEKIGVVDPNIYNKLSEVFRAKFAQNFTPEEANRLASVVSSHLYPSEMDSKEAMSRFDKILNKAALKEAITKSNTSALQKSLESSLPDRNDTQIDKALAQDSLHLLLTAEKKSLKQQIKDNRIDSWGIELPSLISGGVSLASAALWMAGVTGAAVLGPIALGLGLVGCVVGVGIAIHRLKRTGQTQNRMADAQEGLAALQNDPSKLEELRKSNPRVKAAAKALEKSGKPVTADAVIQKLEEFLSIRYVNVTAQAVYRDLLAELDGIAQTPEAKAAFLSTSGRLPGPESDPSGDKQAAYLKLANNSPVLQTLRERALTPLEISRIVHAGSTGEGVKRLLAALNLKEIKTDSFAADANLENPLSARTEYTALQSGSAVLHGNRFDSGMDAALTALKRNPGLLKMDALLKTQQTMGTSPNFENFLRQPMITGTEARELRQEMKQLFFPQDSDNATRSRSANACLQEFTEKVGAGLGPTTSTNRAFLGQEATPESSEALFIARFDQNRKPIRTAFDPLLPLTKPDKSNPLQPNTIICHKGTHRDRGVYITYTREGTQWYRNASGKSTLVDIRPETIAAKRALHHDSPEKRQFDLIHEELFQGCTTIVYGEPDFQVDYVFNDAFDNEDDIKKSIRQESGKELQSLDNVKFRASRERSNTVYHDAVDGEEAINSLPKVGQNRSEPIRGFAPNELDPIDRDDDEFHTALDQTQYMDTQSELIIDNPVVDSEIPLQSNQSNATSLEKFKSQVMNLRSKIAPLSNNQSPEFQRINDSLSRFDKLSPYIPKFQNPETNKLFIESIQDHLEGLSQDIDKLNAPIDKTSVNLRSLAESFPREFKTAYESLKLINQNKSYPSNENGPSEIISNLNPKDITFVENQMIELVGNQNFSTHSSIQPNSKQFPLQKEDLYKQFGLDLLTVKGDGNCFYYATKVNEQLASGNISHNTSERDGNDQRKVLLDELKKLTPQQVKTYFSNHKILYSTWEGIQSGLKSDNEFEEKKLSFKIDSTAWGNSNQLRLSAIRTKRTQVSIEPESRMIYFIKADGQAGSFLADDENAKTRIGEFLAESAHFYESSPTHWNVLMPTIKGKSEIS